MEEQSSHRAMELLQTATTISAIAIALATVSLDEGPAIGELYLIPISFLTAGLFALAGSLYAMGEVWQEAGMSWRMLYGAPDPIVDAPNPIGRTALLVTTRGLILLGLAYIALLLANAP